LSDIIKSLYSTVTHIDISQIDLQWLFCYLWYIYRRCDLDP